MYNTPLMKQAFPVARETNKARNAEERLRALVQRGAGHQRRVIEMVSNMVIKDALLLPSDLEFYWSQRLHVKAKERDFTVHSHALNQMSSVLEYPRNYQKKLQQGIAGIDENTCRDKLLADLNWHARHAKLKNRRGQPAKYLVRYVDGEIRGYLSQSFKRHLASKPLMRAFLEACETAGLQPIDGYASPVRTTLECALPYVFEPYDGEFVAVGLAWTNSDFGGGRLKVSMFMRRIHGEASAVLQDGISAVHIGPIIEEADIEMSDETHDAELTAQKKAVRDTVWQQLKPDSVQKLMDIIAFAQEEDMPWHKLKGELSRLLQKKEMEHVKDLLKGTADDQFEELPPIRFDEEDDPVASRYWASTVVGQIAEREGSAERKKELQEFAGQILSKTKVS